MNLCQVDQHGQFREIGHVIVVAWFTDADEVSYELTRKGESFRGHDVSRKSVASLVAKLALNPELEVGESRGMSEPT